MPRYRWRCKVCGNRSVKRGGEDGSACDRCACDDWLRIRRTRKPDPEPEPDEGDAVADEPTPPKPRDWFLTLGAVVLYVLSARGLAAFLGW